MVVFIVAFWLNVTIWVFVVVDCAWRTRELLEFGWATDISVILSHDEHEGTLAAQRPRVKKVHPDLTASKFN
jgi:hypothetical protein